MPASKPSTGPNIIVVIFLAVAVLMLAIAAISAVSSGRALARERTAPGSVVDTVIRQATDGTLYYRPVVVFALPDGAQRTLQLTEESTAPAYEVDEAVTIAYDPERPDHCPHQNFREHGGDVDLAADHGHPGRGFPGRDAVRPLGSPVRGRIGA